MIEVQNQASVGHLREQLTNDVYYLNQLLDRVDSLPTSTRSGILSRLTILQGHLKSTQSDQLEAANSKLDILGVPQSLRRPAVECSGEVSRLGIRVDHRSLFNLNTTLRSIKRDEFNWYSIWGNDPNCVQVSEVTIPQAFYRNVRSIPNNPYTCMEHFQACYTGPEVGGRICLLGETTSKSNVSMIIMDEKLKQVEAIIESEPINAYMFTFLSNCDIYVNNQGEITIRSPKLLTPYILPIKTVKYYSHQRSNMNRNLLSDILNVYVVGKSIYKSSNSKKKGPEEGVFVYPLTMFKDQKSITSTQPLHIPQSEHTVHIALNSKRIYGLKPNGGVFWYHKKKHQMRVNQLHEKFQSMRINVDEKGNPVYDQFKPYYSAIEANEKVVVVAADRQHEHKNIFAILHPVTLVEYHRLEVAHGSTFVAGQVDPIHMMKLFVMQDLCMLIALNRKETIKILMIHKYKLVLLREVIITTRGMALWGLQFHKPTDEIIVHGNTTVFKKLRITLHKKQDEQEDVHIEDNSLRTEEIDSVDPVVMEKAVAEFKQPIRLKNFQDVVDHFSVKKIADRGH